MGLGSRRTTWLVAGSASLGILALRDPNEPGSYGICPFRSTTGWDCPFCGTLRGTYALLHADVPTALSSNLLLPLFIAIAATWGWTATASDCSAAPSWFRPRPAIYVGLAVLIGFWVARNLPGLDYLNSSS